MSGDGRVSRCQETTESKVQHEHSSAAQQQPRWRGPLASGNILKAAHWATNWSLLYQASYHSILGATKTAQSRLMECGLYDYSIATVAQDFDFRTSSGSMLAAVIPDVGAAHYYSTQPQGYSLTLQQGEASQDP